MAKHTFAAVMPQVFASEGGYVDHPQDPGGATNFGITHKTLAAWRGRPVTRAEVKALSKVEAGEIYRARYWHAVNGDDLPAGLDFCVFDFAINSGPQRAVESLQRIVKVPADGVVGVVTLQAIRARGNAAGVVNDLCDARLAFLKRLSTWGTFGRGWTARVSMVRQRSLALAQGGTLPRQPDDPGVSGAPERQDGQLAKILALIVAAAVAAAVAWLKFGG